MPDAHESYLKVLSQEDLTNKPVNLRSRIHGNFNRCFSEATRIDTTSYRLLAFSENGIRLNNCENDEVYN